MIVKFLIWNILMNLLFYLKSLILNYKLNYKNFFSGKLREFL